MPITHAALRQLRKDRRRQLRNQAVRSELRTLSKRLLKLLGSQQRQEAASLLTALSRKLDRAASHGVIHRNTAARSKSRLTRRLNAIKTK